jgi:hypothetical protein
VEHGLQIAASQKVLAAALTVLGASLTVLRLSATVLRLSATVLVNPGEAVRPHFEGKSLSRGSPLLTHDPHRR